MVFRTASLWLAHQRARTRAVQKTMTPPSAYDADISPDDGGGES
jgi:hypothetical protein